MVDGGWESWIAGQRVVLDIAGLSVGAKYKHVVWDGYTLCEIFCMLVVLKGASGVRCQFSWC